MMEYNGQNLLLILALPRKAMFFDQYIGVCSVSGTGTELYHVIHSDVKYHDNFALKYFMKYF